MRLLNLLFPLIGIIFLASCQRPDSRTSQGLIIYAAASLTDAMTDIGHKFTEDTGIPVTFNFAGSGALARQILATPKADIFLSANQKWMDEVANAGLLLDGSRMTLLSNQLVVIQNPESHYTWGSPSTFFTQPFRYLSIGDPESVPAGRYAKQWMEKLPLTRSQSAWDTVQNKISPATDVRSALFQVRSNRDVVGIVYRTDSMAYPEAVAELYAVPLDESPDISYPAAILAGSNTLQEAREFLTFLQSSKAIEVFQNLGFVVGIDHN